MSKSESKYLNTALRMDEAFLHLLNKKEFEYITVKEICERAGVNRSTFYLHYETLNDLLDETSELFNKKFFSSFEQVEINIDQVHTAPLDDLFLITPKYLKPWLQFIKENKNLYRTVVKRYDSLNLGESVFRSIMKIVDSILDRHHVPNDNRKYIMSFYFEGLNGMITEWLKDDCQKPEDEVIKIITDCIKQ